MTGSPTVSGSYTYAMRSTPVAASRPAVCRNHLAGIQREAAVHVPGGDPQGALKRGGRGEAIVGRERRASQFGSSAGANPVAAARGTSASIRASASSGDAPAYRTTWRRSTALPFRVSTPAT